MLIKRKDAFLVSIQFLLFLLYLFEFNLGGFNLNNLIRYFFLSISIVGVVVMVVSVLQLRTNLSVFPSPKEGSHLITNGLFRFSRHPIYSGIIMSALSFALFSGSCYKLIISSLLLTLLYFKSSYEEEMLQKNFPEYSTYKKKVGRFFPNFL